MKNPNSGEEGPLENTSKLTRRAMIKYLGAGAATVVAGGVVGGYAYKRGMRLSSTEARRLESARIVVVGGSIGGLTVAARLLRGLPQADVTVVEPRLEHHYQPGYTLVAAGVYEPSDVLFKQESLLMPGMRWIRDAVAAFEPEQNRVVTLGGETVGYDFLVVALGVEMDRGSIEGFDAALESPHAANIYDLGSAGKYRELAGNFSGGEAVFTYPTGYVKCGGAPQKICWLSEDLWRRSGKRDKVEVHFLTPQPSLFPVVPVIDRIVMPMMEERGIHNHYQHNLRAIDVSTRTAIFEESTDSGAKRELRKHYDLLHPMPRFRTPLPLRAGPLTAEGIGGQLEVDRHTLRHKRYANIFGVGDCAATGAPKTAATIRKQAPVVVGNLFDIALDREPSHVYDGTSGCPLLTRYGRCMMFEFDFEGKLVNEWLYQSTRETRLWWNFKVHGLKRLYRHVMINGWV